MNKTILIIVLGILSIASISTVMSSSGWGEEKDDEHYGEEYDSDDQEHGLSQGGWLGSRADVQPAENGAYRSECGGCHFAYQPGLLPQHDWGRIMDLLEDHYGDDASLEEKQAAAIRNYLFENAADRSSQSRSRAFASGSEAGEALPRITATDYFRREHYEIPGRFVQGNSQVGSFSNCQACHRNAAAGIYNEHQVVIPGVGQWDD